MKVKHSQSRTVQVQSYEPHLISYEVEEEFDPQETDAATVMSAMKNTVSQKLEEDVAGLLEQKANCK
jgi:hypothetical protein